MLDLPRSSSSDIDTPPPRIAIPTFLGRLSNDGPSGGCRRIVSSDSPSATGLDVPVLRFRVRSTVGDGIAILSASDSYPGEI